MKNSSNTKGNRTRDLPVCNAVPQPTELPQTSKFIRRRPTPGKRKQVAVAQCCPVSKWCCTVLHRLTVAVAQCCTVSQWCCTVLPRLTVAVAQCCTVSQWCCTVLPRLTVVLHSAAPSHSGVAQCCPVSQWCCTVLHRLTMVLLLEHFWMTSLRNKEQTEAVNLHGS